MIAGRGLLGTHCIQPGRAAGYASRSACTPATPFDIVSASILVGTAVLVESSLSFLGYGVQPPDPSWGRMLSDARDQLIRAPHLALFPGLAIFLTVFSFNMLGDALRDKLDPRLRGAN
jgi:ABC-type dipeptide/oligopeptide/nickel transport system permease subunit